MSDIPRIKRNIDKMLGQGAPEADIDAYLSGEGVSAAELRAYKGDPNKVVERGNILPLGTYEDGTTRMAWPKPLAPVADYFRSGIYGTPLPDVNELGESMAGLVSPGSLSRPAVSGKVSSLSFLRDGPPGGLRRGVQQATSEAAAANVDVAPALVSENALMRWAVPHLVDSPVGGPLADQATRAVKSVDNQLNRLLATDGARPTAAESGQMVQEVLRGNLTRESMPDVRSLPPERLQDLSGVAPGPAYNPRPPQVEPRRTQVEPVTPDSYLAEVGGRVKPVEPRRAEVMPQYRTVAIDEIMPPPEIRSREMMMANELRRIEDAHAALMKEWGPQVDSLKRVKGVWSAGRDFDNQWLGSPVIGAQRDRANQMHDQISELALQHQRISSELETLRAGWEQQRPKLHAEAQARANTQAEIEAAKRSAIQQRDFSAEAARETERLRQAAIEAERPRAQAEAERLTQQRRDQLAAIDRRETERLQAEADAKFNAELAARKGDTTPFQLGRSAESYPTEFAAAYEQVARNAPKGSTPALGRKNDPEQTSVGRLIDEFGAELRRAGKLAGYKGGPFADDGRIKPELVRELKSRLGTDVAKTLLYHSEVRATGHFTSGVRGLHDFRTEVGRAIREIKKSKYSPSPRGEDEALLARLYKALDEDITAFASRAGEEGQAFLRQRGEIDRAYEQYINEMRRPLSRIYGDKVSPEQAIQKLADAARVEGGDIKLLRAAYRVVNDKGDPLRLTKSILTQASNGEGLQGFLVGYRSLSPEAKSLLFSSSEGREFRASIDRLAGIAQRLEPYMSAVDRNGAINLRELTRGKNMLFGAGLYFNFATTIGLAAGGLALSHALASKRFAKWLSAVPGTARNGVETSAFRQHMARLGAIAAQDQAIAPQIMWAINSVLDETVGVKPAVAGTREAFESGDFSRNPGRAGPMYPADLEESSPALKERVSAVDAAIKAGRSMQVEYGGDKRQFTPMEFIQSAKGDVSVVGKTEDGDWRTYRLDRMNISRSVPPGIMKLGGPKRGVELEQTFDPNDNGIVVGNQFPPDPGGVRSNIFDQNYDPTFERSPGGDRYVGPPASGPRGMPPRRFSDPSQEFYGQTGGAPSFDYNDVHAAWEAVRSAADKRWPGMFPGFGEDKQADEKMAVERDAARQRRIDRGPGTLDVLIHALAAGVPQQQIDLVARDMRVFGEWRRYLMQNGPQARAKEPAQ